MTKQGLIILVVAVLAVGFAAAAIASSMGGSSDQPARHTMPNGQTMQGESMESGSMPGTEHRMGDGQVVPGSGEHMDGGGMGGSGSMGGTGMGQ